jgi:hypothetical protein
MSVSDSCFVFGERQQLLVGNVSCPQEERQARREIDIADAMSSLGSACSLACSMREHEVRTGENRSAARFCIAGF